MQETDSSESEASFRTHSDIGFGQYPSQGRVQPSSRRRNRGQRQRRRNRRRMAASEGQVELGQRSRSPGVLGTSFLGSGHADGRGLASSLTTNYTSDDCWAFFKKRGLVAVSGEGERCSIHHERNLRWTNELATFLNNEMNRLFNNDRLFNLQEMPDSFYHAEFKMGTNRHTVQTSPSQALDLNGASKFWACVSVEKKQGMELTAAQVSERIRHMGGAAFQGYASTCLEQGINAKTAWQLTDENLRNVLHVHHESHRVTLLEEFKCFQPDRSGALLHSELVSPPVAGNVFSTPETGGTQ